MCVRPSVSVSVFLCVCACVRVPLDVSLLLGRVTLKTIRAPSKMLVAGDLEIVSCIASALVRDFPERELYIGD